MTPKAFHVAGDATLSYSAMLYPADGQASRNALFVFAHGAGAGQSHPFMVRYARGLAERGIDVVTFDFPYMQAGRKSPDRAPVLEACFHKVIAASMGERHVGATRLFIGGKSMGGRMATHLAAAQSADEPPLSGVIVFGYPLQPPGGSKHSPDRVSHLLAIRVPTLIVQGTRDTFGGPSDIATTLDAASRAARTKRPPVTVYPIDGGDHSLMISRKPSADTRIWDAVADFVASG